MNFALNRCKEKEKSKIVKIVFNVYKAIRGNAGNLSRQGESVYSRLKPKKVSSSFRSQDENGSYQRDSRQGEVYSSVYESVPNSSVPEPIQFDINGWKDDRSKEFLLKNAIKLQILASPLIRLITDTSNNEVHKNLDMQDYFNLMLEAIKEGRTEEIGKIEDNLKVEYDSGYNYSRDIWKNVMGVFQGQLVAANKKMKENLIAKVQSSSSLVEENKELKKEVEGLKEKLRDQTQESRKEMLTKKKKLQISEKKISILTQKIKDKDTSNKKLQEEIERLNRQIQTSSSAQEKELKLTQEEYKVIQDRVSSLEKHNKELLEDNSGLKITLIEHESTIEDKNLDIIGYTNQIKQLTSDNSGLKITLIEQESNMEDKNLDIIGYKKQIKRLNSEKDEITKQLQHNQLTSSELRQKNQREVTRLEGKVREWKIHYRDLKAKYAELSSNQIDHQSSSGNMDSIFYSNYKAFSEIIKNELITNQDSEFVKNFLQYRKNYTSIFKQYVKSKQEDKQLKSNLLSQTTVA